MKWVICGGCVKVKTMIDHLSLIKSPTASYDVWTLPHVNSVFITWAREQKRRWEMRMMLWWNFLLNSYRTVRSKPRCELNCDFCVLLQPDFETIFTKEYKGLLERFVTWGNNNHLQLRNSKTNKHVIDYNSLNVDISAMTLQILNGGRFTCIFNRARQIPNNQHSFKLGSQD